MTITTPGHTLIVFALEAEAGGLFDGLPVVYCGVGKVNATMRLARALAEGRARGQVPDLVLNLGSAGSPAFKAGSLVNCTRFIQRDFDVTALGCPAYATPFEDIPVVLENGRRLSSWPEGICGTGDNFATDGAARDWNVVDMEAYALAKTCLVEKVPFACLKYITDGADGHAAASWEEGLPATARCLRQALEDIG